MMIETSSMARRRLVTLVGNDTGCSAAPNKYAQQYTQKKLRSLRGGQRADLFERDYPAFLLSLASSIRTGLDPLLAFTKCADLFAEDSVIAQEIKETSRAIDTGVREDQAFAEFASSVNHPDIELFRAALILSRRQGSSLAVCLQRLARVTRQRQSFRRKMRGAVAMQRLSAFGIAGCTVIVMLIQFTSNPQALRDAWEFPLGRLALCGGLMLALTGVVWMIRLSGRKL